MHQGAVAFHAHGFHHALGGHGIDEPRRRLGGRHAIRHLQALVGAANLILRIGRPADDRDHFTHQGLGTLR